MVIYPVLDIQHGLVVRGAGGDRARYRPIESPLVSSPEPLHVARAFREHFGLERLYVADLDALGGALPAEHVFSALREDGFRLLVDAGVRSARDALVLADLGVDEVVAALETLPSPGVLGEVVAAIGPARTVFSLDLRAGVLLGDRSGWPERDPEAVARTAQGHGARRILVLDLAQVGSGKGPAHVDLVRRLAGELPGVEWLAGGGVRSAEDLDLLGRAGAGAVLVASALHQGTLGREDLAGFKPDGGMG